ncbi:MAG TPA: hypothetical protein VFR14_02005 [Candidatus Limnocylindrales bacterium]|nr:hypothetical protein [Candidatus Limnocylindrales bacterium]
MADRRGVNALDAAVAAASDLRRCVFVSSVGVDFVGCVTGCAFVTTVAVDFVGCVTACAFVTTSGRRIVACVIRCAQGALDSSVAHPVSVVQPEGSTALTR